MGHARRRTPKLLAALVLPVLFWSAPTVRSADPPAARPVAGPPDVTYQHDIRPFLTKHCFDCHGNGKAKADFSFDKYKDDPSVWNDRKAWDNVRQMIETHEMPPTKRTPPPPGEVDAVLKAINGLFERHDRTAKPNVGRVTLRRLNKTEYNNTIRDLLGADFKPAEDFPADDVGYGFDNIGDVLSVTPMLLEKYLIAAEQVLDQAIVILDPPKPSKSQIGAIRRNATSTAANDIGGTISFDEGDYVIRCRVSGDQVGDEPVRAMVRLDGKDLEEFVVKAPQKEPVTVTTKVRAKTGTARVSVALLNPFALPPPATQATTQPATKPTTQVAAATKPVQPQQPPPQAGFGRRNFPPLPVSDGRTRILFLQNIEVEGPFDPPPPTPPAIHKRLMAHADGLAPRDAAREIVTRFATRAFRRPVQPAEVEQCLKMYDLLEKQGKRFELRVRAALYRVLVSPHFLFRVELDPPAAEKGATYAINEYELASRLSYFLWNSMPDDELFALAARGQLRANLDAQVRRMVKDPKSASFVQGFAEQWLTLRKLDLASPDPKLYPTFDNNLRQAMIRESTLFFDAVLREDRSLLDLLDANFTFVNEQLAKHYGLSGVTGKEFVKVALPPGRGGILTHASILTLTSNATRTSPVKRGKFVLEQILNTPPPPPPPDIPALEDHKELKGTLRQRLEQHRADAMCASCHQRMDPIGFAFENYDPTGAWRETDDGAKIDASGVLPDGRAFDGPAELKAILRDKKNLFARCLAEKLLTYALGRGLEYYDRRAIDQIMSALDRHQYRFSTLLNEIVTSDPFQKRTATGEAR